jgi:hypothetical protein
MILLGENVLGLLGGLVLLGIGLGLTQGPISYVGLQLAPAEKQGQISGLIAITRSMGGATGITLAGVLLTRSVFRLSGSSVQINASDVWTTDGGGAGALAELPGHEADVVRQVVIDGLVHGWYWALGAALVGLLAAFFLDKTTPSRE